MQTIEFSLRYSGGISDRGVMDASDAERVITGARQLLSAHCHFFVRGQIPSRLTSSNKYFQVVVLPPTDGSWRAKLHVCLTAASVGATGTVGSKIAGETYDVFLAEGVDRALHTLKERAENWKWKVERSPESRSTDPAWDAVGDTYQSLQC